jgi:hypothetical protein
VRRLLAEFESSERHVCELMAVPRSSGRYRAEETTAWFRNGCANWRVSIRALAIGVCICTCMRRWE